MDLDQVHPADRRPFPLERTLDGPCRRLLSVEPGKDSPGVEAASDRRLLARLVAAVFEQARRHSALGEPAPKRGGASGLANDDAIVDGFEVDVGSRPQASLLPQYLRDNNLALGSHSLSHTLSV